MAPLISVIIPALNRQGSLLKAISSCLAQTYGNIEIVITDNSSESIELVLCERFNNDPRVKYFKNECNIGPVKNWREGYKKAKGEYWILLPDDDFLLNPFYFEDAVSVLSHDAGISVFFADCVHSYPERSMVASSSVSGVVETSRFIREFWAGINVPSIANVVRKKCTDELYFFYNNDILYSDIQLWLMLASKSSSFYFYNTPSINYILDGGNIVLNMSSEKLIENSKFISDSVPSGFKLDYILRYMLFVSSIYPVRTGRVFFGVATKNEVLRKDAILVFLRFQFLRLRRVISSFIK